MASLSFSRSILGFMLVVFFFISPAHSLTCSSMKFTNNKLYQSCNDLPTLSSTLHWTYNPTNSSISIAFTAPAESEGWVSWAINPNGTMMAGGQSLIAFKQSDGSMIVKTYDLISYSKVVQSNLSFDVWDTSAEYKDGVMKIFAQVALPGKKTTINQLWQVGTAISNGGPKIHAFQPMNLNAKGTLDLKNGTTTAAAAGGNSSRAKKKNIHGILNAVSWGLLFPLGVIIARYLKTFQSADPAWFYLHVFCQISAYAIGVAGWATGLKLGSQSAGFQYTTHRNLGIALFALATLQIFALFLRPKKEHKLRIYWNFYHHGVGYTVLVLGIINVFKGLDILDPEKKWKSAYIVALAVLGGIALLLEVITWIVVLKRKSSSTKPYDGYNNGQGRQQPLTI